MEKSILLVCKYGIYSTVINVSFGFKFEEFINILCTTWSALDREIICVTYSIVGHPSYLVQNSSDFANMLSLVSALGLAVVDVSVTNCSTSYEGHELESSSSEIVQFEDSRLVDVERNSFNKYCSHEEKLLLSSSWGNSIHSVGQKFEGGAAEFRDALCKYSIEVGFEFTYVKNDSIRVTAECAYRASKGCMWRVHASVAKANKFFYIKTLNNDHTCGAAVRTSENSRMSSNLVAGLILEQVREKPLTRPIDVVKDMKSNYGVSINYFRGWLGVEKAKASIYGDYSLSFDQLRWYFDEAWKNNPGSRFELDFDEENKRFKKVFIAFRACIDGFNFCRPMLFLDGTFLKGRYKGVLLSATGKDGNEGFFPVAYAIVDSETKDNWFWFLQLLSEILAPDRVLTFISDRNCGIVEGVPRFFPNSYHSFCLEHLKRNLKDSYSSGYTNPFRERIVSKFCECAYAPTKASFLYKLNELKKEGGEIVEGFLRFLPYKNWSDAYFEGRRYGEMYSNVAESFNSWIREARHLPITNLVDKIRLQVMKLMADRRVAGSKWNKVLCPRIDATLEKAFKAGRSWNVSSSCANVFEVHSFPSVVVDLRLQSCSCRKWEINGCPCEHAVAAIHRSGNNLNSFVEPFFHADMYRQCYSGSIVPVATVGKPSFSMDDAMILPPVTKRPAGRPRKNRIASTGEFTRVMKCSRCGSVGRHNKRTCKEALVDS